MNAKLKKIQKRNHLPLNKFHQLERKGSQKPDEESIKKLKKKVRDLERLIDSGKLGEEASEIKNKELSEKKKQLAQRQSIYTQKQKKIEFFSKKYQKVKAIDQLKLKRKLKQITRKLEAAADEEEKEKLKQQEEQLLSQQLYIQHYPKDKQYISLFGKNLNEHAQKQQQEILEKSIQKKQASDSRKYQFKIPIPQEQPKPAEDDFFADEAMPVEKKTFVDRQGKTRMQQSR